MKSLFGISKNGEEVFKFTLGNKDSFRVEIINFGAIITGIYTRGNSGLYENIVLNYENLEDYELNPAYVGTTVGRIAGRTKNSSLFINSKEYKLSQNLDKNYLHSAEFGISKRVWKIDEERENKLVLSIDDPYREGMPPANVSIKAEFELTSENTLNIKYSAKTDSDTYINITNHSYFNLDAGKNTVKNHLLKIKSKDFFELDDDMVPYRISSLKNSSLNFSELKTISEVFCAKDEQIIKAKGIDHPFLLEKSDNQIIVSSELSGRSMKISTDQDAVIVYSGNYLSEASVPSGKKLNNNYGICFECQNSPKVKSNNLKIVLPDGEYENNVKYEFNK